MIKSLEKYQRVIILLCNQNLKNCCVYCIILNTISQLFIKQNYFTMFSKLISLLISAWVINKLTRYFDLDQCDY